MSTNYHESKEEAERLSRVLNRSVVVKQIECDCDYNRNCFYCGGEGKYFKLVFTFCGHGADSGDECNLDQCAEHERAQIFPLEHPAIRSLTEAESERKESEAA